MNIADYISAFPGATDDDLISAGFAPQAVQAFRTGYMPPPSGDPSKIQPTVMPANTFGDVASQYGNEYISGGMDLAFNPNVSSYDALPQSMQGGFMEPFNREVMSILDLPLGLLSAAGGIGQKAIALGSEAFASGTQSEERLARDWIGGVEGSGFAPEGRMLAAIADAGGIGAAGRKIAERANQPGPVPTMYSNPIAGLLDNPKSGITAYHGSPHSFDKFSMDKIGTGEGAQAYGPGLYFAENEGVARGYRDALSGRNYRMAGGSDEAANMFGRDVVDIFESSGGNRGEISNTLGRLRNQVTQGLQEAGVNSISKLDDNFNPLFVADIKATNDRAERLAAFLRSDYAKLDEGSMYEVNINANPEDFLDWERPMSEQPQVVRDFAKTRWQQIYGRDPDPSIEGEYIAKMASPQSGIDNPDWLLRGGPADDQRERLRAAGIPGIRYLDAGSRSFTPTTIKDTPSGSELYWGNDPRPVDVFPTRQAAEEAAKQFDTRSRNYVVFDENLINIVKKYGIAGAATMLGVSAIDVEKALADNVPSSQWDQLVVGPQ